MRRSKIGDIVEIQTAKGLAYAHYANKHKQYGALLRVFRVFHDTRPKDFTELVNREPTFICFFPLSGMVNLGIVSIVGNVALPAEAQAFPVFRAGVSDPSTLKAGVRWLWDGEKEWRVSEFNAEQRKFPIRGTWNDTLLIERLESGWTAETDPT